MVLIETLKKRRKIILNCYGEDAGEDLNHAIEDISQLKRSIEIGENLFPFNDNDPDTDQWNDDIREKQKLYDVLTYYNCDLLFAECYVYRRVREIFAIRKKMYTFDPFGFQKTEILQKALTSIRDVIKFLVCNRYLEASYVMPVMEIKLVLDTLLKNSLWANRIDLSLTEGSTDFNHHLLDDLNKYDDYILVNDMDRVFPYLVLSQEVTKEDKLVDLILDNAGYEFLSDLCLANFLVAKCGVRTVNFRIKRIPWFISDVTPVDFSQTVYSVAHHSDPDYQRVGLQWQKYLDSGVWKVYDDIFWCLGLSYSNMSVVDPILYKKLSLSHLIVFKGDLHYRKLVQDCNWEPSTRFTVSRGLFQPAPILAVRTIKSDTIVGLSHGVAERTSAKAKDWLFSGNYAVVQFDIPNQI